MKEIFGVIVAAILILAIIFISIVLIVELVNLHNYVVTLNMETGDISVISVRAFNVSNSMDLSMFYMVKMPLDNIVLDGNYLRVKILTSNGKKEAINKAIELFKQSLGLQKLKANHD